MFVKTYPDDLIEGFGIKNDETDELEMIFEDHDVYSKIRELPFPASFRFWLFEIGAWDKEDSGSVVLRSTPFVPLGNDIDEVAKLIELMITHVATDYNLAAWKRGDFKTLGVENGNMLTGQKWAEHAEFDEFPATNTKAYWDSLDSIKAKGMEN